MFELRDYQLSAVERAWSFSEHERPCVVSPTGSGKTVVQVALAKKADELGMSTAIMTPRREILEQTERLMAAFGMQAGIVMGQDSHSPYARHKIYSWATVVRRAQKSDFWVPDADLVMIDEAHLALSKKMKARVLDKLGGRCIGFTATPARQTGHGLGDFFDSLMQIATVQELIDRGYLVGCRYFGGAMPDMAGARTVAGDYHQGDAHDRSVVLVGDVVENWLKLASDRHTIAFGVDIAHATALAQRFQRVGVAAAVVSDKTPPDERRAVMSDFRSGAIRVLCNVGIATYGLDVPSCDCIVLARPTKSIPLHLQMLGRGLRPYEGKEHCLVLDHAGNVARLGMAEEEYPWVLDSGKRVQDIQALREKKPEAKPVTCPECSHIFRKSPECPNCGWKIPVRARDIRQTDAELVEITRRREEWKNKRETYLRLLGYMIEHGKNPKRAAAIYRQKFDQWPAWKWRDLSPLMPNSETLGLVKWSNIRYAKSRRA